MYRVRSIPEYVYRVLTPYKRLKRLPAQYTVQYMKPDYWRYRQHCGAFVRLNSGELVPVGGYLTDTQARQPGIGTAQKKKETREEQQEKQVYPFLFKLLCMGKTEYSHGIFSGNQLQ